ncbi:UPF0149 family protein [Aliiglaciecola sp. CAU 1673]|uniref:UPF0149 family protein n=1 Tax=Aliiglaciecola sp. CAU 1673 TaxID=3032595 RepID=UPI0023D97EE4|nr:UPF0149 family protein [Aliiglaciecola sp. CAU 1673]MDF2179456.1 UPF0149 family protein [Aliiglaciecola sp. CAU 1673]
MHKIYDDLCSLLMAQTIASDAAELQGMMVGMLAGGMPPESKEWLSALADFINQGEPLSDAVKQSLNDLFQGTLKQLQSNDFSLALCLPDDAAPINDRGQALLNWVQGFMLGFGLFQSDLRSCSDDVREALEDFAEISRMEEEMNEDEESEQALYEVLEYVRVSSMLCFNELGKRADGQINPPKTLH